MFLELANIVCIKYDSRYSLTKDCLIGGIQNSSFVNKSIDIGNLLEIAARYYALVESFKMAALGRKRTLHS